MRETWRRRWWILVVPAVVGLALALAFGVHQQQVGVTSTSQVLMSGGVSGDDERGSGDDTNNLNQYVNQRMLTYAQLASTAQVATPAARAVGLDPADLAERTTGTVSGDTTVVSIAVRGDTPEEAVAAARSVTRSFVAAVAAIETPRGGQARVRADVVSDPTRPSAPVSLPLVVQALLGLLIGAVLGGLVLLLERASWPARLAASIRGDDPAAVGAGR